MAWRTSLASFGCNPSSCVSPCTFPQQFKQSISGAWNFPSRSDRSQLERLHATANRGIPFPAWCWRTMWVWRHLTHMARQSTVTSKPSWPQKILAFGFQNPFILDIKSCFTVKKKSEHDFPRTAMPESIRYNNMAINSWQKHKLLWLELCWLSCICNNFVLEYKSRLLCVVTSAPSITLMQDKSILNELKMLVFKL